MHDSTRQSVLAVALAAGLGILGVEASAAACSDADAIQKANAKIYPKGIKGAQPCCNLVANTVDDSTGAHHQDVGAHAFDLGHVVRCQQDRRPG